MILEEDRVMRKTPLYMGVLIFLLIPVLALTAEVYKWVDEKGTIHLTDDQKKIPEKYREQVETISVPDKYEEPSRPPEKLVVPFEPEPEKPKIKPVEPPSGFIPFERFIYITEGMTEAEVLSRLGPPTREIADEIEVSRFGRGSLFKQEALVKRYYYIGNPDLGERTTIIHFKNGIVQKIEWIFPPTW